LYHIPQIMEQVSVNLNSLFLTLFLLVNPYWVNICRIPFRTPTYVGRFPYPPEFFRIGP